MTTN
jgi:hypothetical protein